jgi:magnesium transporter
MFSAAAMSHFEGILAKHLAVAFFVPAIVYLADAVGTQTEAIVVRSLSLHRLPLQRILPGELRTGLLIGLSLALLAFPIVAATTSDPRLGLSVSLAIVVAGGVATSIGLVFPWLLQRMGTDPAFASGPVATVVQDVLSILVYLAIASAVMG